MRRRREKYSIIAVFQGQNTFFGQNQSQNIVTLLSVVTLHSPSPVRPRRRMSPTNVYISVCALKNKMLNVWPKSGSAGYFLPEGPIVWEGLRKWCVSVPVFFFFRLKRKDFQIFSFGRKYFRSTWKIFETFFEKFSKKSLKTQGKSLLEREIPKKSPAAGQNTRNHSKFV